MANEDYPGKRVIDALGLLAGPNELERDLHTWLAGYEAGGCSSAELPLNALQQILATMFEAEGGDPDIKFGGMDPCRPVEVPLWVAWGLVQCWIRYKNANGELTAGKAFGIEGAKRGKHSPIKMRKTQAHRMGYALEVWAERRRDPMVTFENAVEIVARRHIVSDSVVRQAWTKYGPKVERAVSKPPATTGQEP